MTRTVKLRDICDVDSLEREEMLSHLLDEMGTAEWENVTFTVRQLNPDEFAGLTTIDGRTSPVDAFRSHAKPWQREVVKQKVADFDRDRILICSGTLLVDGNHHLVAAHRLGEPVWIIDLDEPDPEPELEARP